LFAAALVLSLAACGGGSNTPSHDTQDTQQNTGTSSTDTNTLRGGEDTPEDILAGIGLNSDPVFSSYYFCIYDYGEHYFCCWLEKSTILRYIVK